MRKALKWIGSLLGALLLLALLVLGWAWIKSDRAMARRFPTDQAPLPLPTDAASLARGGHLFATRGCADCHGAQGEGKLVFDAGPVIRLVAPNITQGGRIREYRPEQVATAIRNGVAADGRPLVFMPSPEFHELSDADTAALVAYLTSLPASANDPGPLAVRPLARVMYALGKFPLLPAEAIDQRPRVRSAPPPGPTAAYGAYIAHGCSGCHGGNFAGQHVPGTPPSFPDAANLTPAALGRWQLADFTRALREGKRPDGSDINTFMPWQALGKMSDEEIAAVWAYLQTRPPVASPRK